MLQGPSRHVCAQLGAGELCCLNSFPAPFLLYQLAQPLPINTECFSSPQHLSPHYNPEPLTGGGRTSEPWSFGVSGKEKRQSP